jgi:glycosyltransferase involved in cell wall biosynthesis
MALADHIITVSEKARKALVEYYGPTEEISVINNGVDLRVFRRLHLKRSDFVLFAGNILAHYRRKGIPTLLRAFSGLVKDFDHLSLVFVGKPNDQLRRANADLGIASRVQHAGYVTREKLVELYNRARVVVLPSLYEPYGLVINEAMACGTPVVVSDEVGPCEMITKARAGLVFHAGNHIELQNCLSLILKDKHLASTLGSSGHEYAQRNLGWKIVARKYLELFESHRDSK